MLKQLTSIALVISIFFAVPVFAQTTDVDQIKKVVVNDGVRPGYVLPKGHETIVRQVIIAQPYALVSWLLGEGGGQTILKKQDGHWTVLANSGGSFGLDGLVHYGVPQATASRIWAKKLALDKRK